MARTHLKALIALALVTAPAGLALAGLDGAGTGATNPTALSTGADEVEGDVIETFEADLDPVPSTGELDLRIDEGVVHAVGWEKDAYRIEVVRPSADARVPGEPEVETTFDDASTGDHLDLSLTVDQEDVYQVGANVAPTQGHVGVGQPDLLVLAKVPASIDYDLVHLCQGQQVHQETPVHPPTAAATASGGDVCLEPEHRSAGGARVTASASTNGSGPNLETGAVDLSGGQLVVDTVNGDQVSRSIEFDAVSLTSNNGDLLAEEVAAGETVLVSNNGDVDASGSLGTLAAESNNGEVDIDGEVEDGSVVSNNGDVTVDATPTASGAFEAASNNGEVDVTVPTGDDYGYDAVADTNNGEAEIHLSGASQEEDGDDAWEENHAEARTTGYDDKPIRWELTATSNNGDVLVTDGSADASEEGSGSGSSDVGLLSAR